MARVTPKSSLKPARRRQAMRASCCCGPTSASTTTASAARLIDVNEREFGKLAYGGFLYVDVKAGDETLSRSGVSNRWAGNCAVRIRAKAGDTIYLDVTPRPVTAADFVSVAATAAIPGPAISTVGDVLVDSAVERRHRRGGRRRDRSRSCTRTSPAAVRFA